MNPNERIVGEQKWVSQSVLDHAAFDVVPMVLDAMYQNIVRREAVEGYTPKHPGFFSVTWLPMDEEMERHMGTGWRVIVERRVVPLLPLVQARTNAPVETL